MRSSHERRLPELVNGGDPVRLPAGFRREQRQLLLERFTQARWPHRVMLVGVELPRLKETHFFD